MACASHIKRLYGAQSMENRHKPETSRRPSRPHRSTAVSDVLCFGKCWTDLGAHQELLARCARERRVFFVEDAVPSASHPRLTLASLQRNLYVVRPHVRDHAGAEHRKLQVQGLLTMLALDVGIQRPLTWFVAPRDPGLSTCLGASLTICGPMTARYATLELARSWAPLIERADIVLARPAPSEADDDTSKFWDEQWAALRLMIASVLIGRMRDHVVEA
jgi:hypothetical protein